MNLDRVTLAGFDGAVRGRVRRLDVQFLRWRLVRRCEQTKDENGQPP